MFTGIISEIGQLRSRDRQPGTDQRLEIIAPKTADSLRMGSSVACNGICLSAVDITGEGFSVDVSSETLSCTTCGEWLIGEKINLESSLRVGDEINGHLVFGHVDAVGVIEDRESVQGSLCFKIGVKAALLPFIAVKGSVAVNGVSLTVNRVEREFFTVNIIPHTQHVTTVSILNPGDKVNIEIDMLARYVARLREADRG